MDLKTLLDTPPWEWPDDARKTFRKSLVDRKAKPSDRLIAAELAGEIVAIDDDLAAVLLTVIGTAGEAEELRAKAAISLGPALELASDGFDDPDNVPITEGMYRKIQDTLQRLYSDPSVPKEVRRRILEASIRAPEDWHTQAVREAYDTADQDWMLTAVFAMRWIPGFPNEIMAALNSPSEEIHYEAVSAAGTNVLDAAWPHVVQLAQNADTPKDLRIAAIEAVGCIRPKEATAILLHLADSRDEEIAEAADEAMSMAEGIVNLDDETEGEWIN